MAERERLAHRRGAEHEGRKWTATVGCFADGRISEIFIDELKEAPIAELAQESAMVASLALQSGCALETLRHALAERGDGPLGAALELGHENRTGNRIGGTRQCRRADEDLQVSDPAYQAT
jgi:hypothetical protein